jgi:molecular chaperone GrpE (heat shock protein)
MTDRKKRPTEMLRSLLTTGTLDNTTDRPVPPGIPDGPADDAPAHGGRPAQADGTVPPETAEPVPEEPPEPVAGDPVLEELAALREEIAALRAEGRGLVTTREQQRKHLEAVERRDAELADRRMMSMLEQLSGMREDFVRLCGDMEERIDRFSPKDVLDSFTAYMVDIENILTDAGARVGPFDNEKLNTLRQRIVDVVPTGDPSLDGMIAERLSDGYEFKGRVLLKEKVTVYKHTAAGGDGSEDTTGDE